MDKPIGVIDSGVGGLTVAREIMRQLPKEEILYFGDTARCPYGSRSWEDIRAFTWEMVNFVREQDVKMLVIACNTATAVVLDEIRDALDIPVIGVVHPGARAALKMTKNNRITVIGTIGTIESKAYLHALKSINSDVEVASLACPQFVPLVERGELEGEKTKAVVQETLAPLLNSHMDTLILGCTHYPLLQGVISEIVGPEVHVICSGAETAREVSTILDHSGLLYTGEKEPCHRFFTSGEPSMFALIARRWLHVEISAESFPPVKSFSLR